MKETKSIDFKKLKSLDQDEIVSVHDYYYDDIYRYVYYRINDEMITEDLTSDVFLRFIESLKTAKGPENNIRGWLIGTASHVVNDYYRKLYKNPHTNLEEHHSVDNPNPTRSIEEFDQSRLLMKALKTLTDEQQNVIVLRFGNGYSLENTAKLMGKNVNAIKALQFRALASLRKKFENLDDE